jgi:hypothetical protein
MNRLEGCRFIAVEGVWFENSLDIREVGDRVVAGQVQKQVVEGNAQHSGNGLVYEKVCAFQVQWLP